jgi:hypothetical protein
MLRDRDDAEFAKYFADSQKPLGRSFWPASELKTVWSDVFADFNQVQMKVFEKRITACETIGTLTSITIVQNTIDIEQFGNSAYSRGDDSGALVCVEYEDKLAPFSIHFSGSQGVLARAIPLKTILLFEHSCTKNRLKF